MICTFSYGTKCNNCLDELLHINTVVKGYNLLYTALLRKYRNKKIKILTSYVDAKGRWAVNSWNHSPVDYCVFNKFYVLGYDQRLFIYILDKDTIFL